jgi:thiamine pyrophosphokinase
MGLKTHVIIGDMDYLIEDLWQNDRSVRRIVYPIDKNRSDTELAIEWALKQGVDKALLLGALGRRFGHILGHCALLIRYPGRVALWDDGVFVQAIGAGQRMKFRTAVNDLISLFPIAGCPRARTSGLRYALNDERLDYASHGLSNVAIKDECSVEVSGGLILLCVEEQDRCQNR